MATFSNCLRIVNAMPQQDQDALLARLDELVAQGLSPQKAQLRAAQDVLAQVEREGGIRKSAARVTATPEFKTFFGKSKVKTEDGKPRVMYHATTRGGFDVFDRMKTTEWRRESMDTVGSWFSDSAGEEGAGRYVPGEDAAIYPVYLRIEKPKVYKTFTSFLDDMHKAAGRDPKKQNPPGVGSTNELRQKLKAQGYDGIQFVRTDNKGLLEEIRELDDLIRTYERKDPEYADELRDERKKVNAQYAKTGGSTEFDDQDVWVAFEPNQIKSAIGNNGDFDINNPSIVKSVERAVDTPEFKTWSRKAPLVMAKDALSYDFKDGQPFVAQTYHGTNADKRVEGSDEFEPDDFETFDLEKGGDKTAASSAEMGIFSTSEPIVSGIYAANLGMGRVLGANLGTSSLHRDAVSAAKESGALQALEAEREEAAQEYSDASGRVIEAVRAWVRSKDLKMNLSDSSLWGMAEAIESVEPEVARLRAAVNEAERRVIKADNDMSRLVIDEMEKGIPQRVMPLFVRMSNPKVYDAGGKTPGDFPLSERIAKAKKAGHDGVVFTNIADPSPVAVHYVSFNTDDIKSVFSKAFEEGSQISKSASRNISPLGFYSALADGIAKVQSKEMAAPGWKQAVKALINKGQAKQDEIDWSGINDFLDLQQGKISKDAVLEYLRGNGVQVEETVLGGVMSASQELEEYASLFDGDTATAEGLLAISRVAEADARRLRRVGEKDEASLRARIAEEAKEMAGGMRDGSVQATKYASYGPPGGENYREVLLTLPEKASPSPDTLAREMFGRRMNDLSPADREQIRAKLREGSAKNYRSSHWDQPNVLAHLRVDDRTDADGKRVLFIREVQSDWGQDGKKKGFQVRGGELTSAEDARLAELSLKDPAAMTDSENKELMSLMAKMPLSESERIANKDRVPSAPFVQKTDAWVGLALKRAVVLAAQEGYDKVAIINGDQAHTMFPKKNNGESSLPGFRSFYDGIVPKVAKEVLKKLGGQVGEVEIARPNASRRDEILAELENEDGKRRPRTSRMQQVGFDITPEMREKVAAGVPLFSRDRQTDTPEFKRFFRDSKVVDAQGRPLVVYHGSGEDFAVFDARRLGENTGYGDAEIGFHFSDNSADADFYAAKASDRLGKDAGVVRKFYLSLQKPLIVGMDESDGNAGGRTQDFLDDKKAAKDYAEENGHDGIIYLYGTNVDSGYTAIAFRPEQIKSATDNNGQFDPANPDIRKAADRPWFDDLEKLKITTNYQLGDLLKTSKKLSWWDRTVGTQYNLAQKHEGFKRVFDAVQRFIGDVSAFATRAADLAPNILPKLESLKDIRRSPLSAEDVKALRDPVFGGTLTYTRDENGDIVQTDDVQDAGVVFTDAELRSMFNLNDRQIGLYREFRRATDQSLADLAISDMLRYVGEDARDIREQVIGAGNVDVAAGIIESHLRDIGAATPERQAMMEATIEAIQGKADQANRLMDRGYAPLSRFGQYTVYVQGQNGEQIYFSMFENERDANKMAREMRDQHPDATVSTGTMSEESYKLFSGVTPETLALFGDALGLEESGIDTKSEAFQQMLKVAKTNRSAMKRLIQRKGIDGYSEDAGRVLAGFVYSNARQIATNLHAGEISKAVSEIKDGDIKDHAIRLMQYVQNPAEEAQFAKALLFTIYLGGNISSALVNLTQTATTTFPYLTQFDGAGSVMARIGDAAKLATRGIRNDADLQQALKRAEEEGIVSPQEVFHLMAQAQGKGQLKSGDGTKLGDASAKVSNFISKLNLGWGKLFSAAEQANRRIAFIAAYKLARDKGMENPFAFAEKAIVETQFLNNKGNRPMWARGAVGGTLFTFRSFMVQYLEFLRRLLGNGPEGKKAFAWALGTLALFAGVGGMPGADDLDDVVDGFAQRVLGKSFDSKQAKKEFFASVFGQTGADFVMGGLTSLPGAPIDLSGRLGLANIAPGTGLAVKKQNYQRDVAEVFGAAGSFASNLLTAVGMGLQGDVAAGAKLAAPVGVQNALKGLDMATLGMYRDTKGRKVIDTNGWEAFAKSLGFQPASVKRVQEASSTQQGLVAQNRIAWQEIRDLAIAGRVERKPEKIAEARRRYEDWNRENPESPLKWSEQSINQGVQEANKSKAQRISESAPKAIRAAVKRELTPAE